MLFSSTLALLPVAHAQSVVPAGTTTTIANGELRYAAGDLMVRRWSVDGVPHAALSRDQGRSWQALANPDDRLHFLLAQFDPTTAQIDLPGVLGAPSGNRLFLVQFQTQILEPYRRALEARGVEVLHYLPENAFFVRGDRAQVLALRQLPFVRWVGDLQNGFKLSEELRAFAQTDGTEALAVNLILAKKSDRETLATQLQGLGAEVADLCDGSVMLQAKVTPAQLRGVLALDTVTWADPTTAIGYDMDNARNQGGANYVENVTMGNYTGQGVRAEITEAFAETHPDFTNTPGRVLVRGTNSQGSHGHCTAGIVGGSGANNLAGRGMMPNCTLIEGAYTSSAAIFSQATGSVNPTLPWRTMVATASWGSTVTTLYTSVSQTMDDALFVSDLTRLNSQSNQNSQNSRPEAWAKNIISGGGVTHGNNADPSDDRWTTASFGPASDGRQKPDICSYYDNVFTSDLPGTAGYNTAAGLAGNYTATFSGTSSATPICAGHTGIIQQMFTDGLFGNALPLPATAANRFENKPHMTTSKALLCGTARPYPVTQVERRKQGWGFPDLANLYDNRNKIVVVDEYETLQMGQSRTYWVWVAPGTTDFRAAMAYADPAGQANSAIHRVNNLDLKVTRFSDGVFWWGNNGLTAGTTGGDQSTPGGVANDRDTLEMVRLVNPPAGIYAVTVTAASIVQDGKVETPALDADFALVVFPTGGGFRNRDGLTVDFVSTGPGNLSVQCGNVPTTGWTNGFTFLAFDTFRPQAFGGFFGLEADGLTTGIWGLPATPGDVFHFTNAPGNYPFQNYTFAPGLVTALAGLKLDAMVTLWNSGTIVAQSNVARVTIQ
ncbi:MAG: S8 family serine peptidase [Planctomycetes bacterium]|nr:S8 family serine peptidase [Planctomycetota bacterium]